MGSAGLDSDGRVGVITAHGAALRGWRVLSDHKSTRADRVAMRGLGRYSGDRHAKGRRSGAAQDLSADRLAGHLSGHSARSVVMVCAHPGGGPSATVVAVARARTATISARLSLLASLEWLPACHTVLPRRLSVQRRCPAHSAGLMSACLDPGMAAPGWQGGHVVEHLPFDVLP